SARRWGVQRSPRLWSRSRTWSASSVRGRASSVGAPSTVVIGWSIAAPFAIAACCNRLLLHPCGRGRRTYRENALTRGGRGVHIPDGYLSPVISVGMGLATVPVWAVATRKVQAILNNRTVPLLAIFAALSFTIMMFNVPVPGGTTAHGVGGTLAAIV